MLGRAMNEVAPNSPSETTNANPAPDQRRPGDDRQVDLAPHPTRRGAEDGSRLPHLGRDRAQGGHR